MIRYERPKNWVKYDAGRVLRALTDAKAAVLSLTQIPYQRSWTEHLQEVQLKREVAGTSRIEGAEFTDRELDKVLHSQTADELETRSQRQARAAIAAYRWIAGQPADHPIDAGLISEVHRLVVVGADDDHCAPGRLRGRDQNVTFGAPAHRGAEGGVECAEAFGALCEAIRKEYPAHDPLIQALALHYHFAAMHPFLDGNGRTARALEALMLQRVGLSDTLFIAMSNYYYEEKTAYLAALAAVRSSDHDLTPFLVFGLKGVERQCRRLFAEIRLNVSRSLFKNMAFDLFRRLQTRRKRVIADRQLAIIEMLLKEDRMDLADIQERTAKYYGGLSNSTRALIRDLNHLISLGAVGYEVLERNRYIIYPNLEWPTQITETEFFRRVNEMPKAKSSRLVG